MNSFFGLSIGKTGLYAYQAALNTTSHNIANSETTGYTRQSVVQTAGVAIQVNQSYGMVGSGVSVSGVVSSRSAYYDQKYRTNTTLLGYYNAKYYYMSEVEEYFNDVSYEGFTTAYDDLYSSLQDLSTDPSSMTERTSMVNYAESFTEYFNSLSENLLSIQEDCNDEVKNSVDKINSYAEQIAALTKQINTLEANGGTANDLRDQRETLIDELSELANVSVTETDAGDGIGVTSYVVKINGQTLVDTCNYNTLKVVARTEKLNQSDADGLYDVVWETGQSFNVTGSSAGGYLKSVIEMRDGNNSENLKGTVTGSAGDTTITLTSPSITSELEMNMPSSGVITIGNKEYTYSSFTYDSTTETYTFNLESALVTDVTDASSYVGESVSYKGIPYYMNQLNELVRTYAQAFNALHKTGEDLNGDEGTNFFTGTNAVTGEDYDIDTVGYYYLTAANFTVSEDIQDDPSLVALAEYSDDGTTNVEDTTILDALLDLQTDTSLFNSGDVSSFFQSIMSDAAINSDKASNMYESQSDIVEMVENQRLSVSGVDTDEEAVELVKYQNAYNLCSKVIQVMTEIYDKLIEETGV